MADKKTNNPTTKIVRKAKSTVKKGSVQETLYPDLFFFRQYPMNPEIIRRLKYDIIEHADKETTLTMNSFRLEKKIDKTYFADLVKKHKELEIAMDYMRDKIAQRRDEGATTRKFDSQFVGKSLPMYSDDWKAIEEWRANLKASDDKSGGTKIVVIDRMPNTQEVKTKIDDTLE